MKNLFSFGCSFTNFKYPTWVDYLSPYFNKSYNFGFSGQGNKAIFNKLIYLLHKKQIKEDDCVVIQWSSLAREDIMIDNKWFSGGVITNTPLFDKDYINNYFSVNQKAYELLSYIYSTKEILKSRNIKFRWFYMLEPWFSDMLGEPGNVPNELIKKYNETFKSGIVDEIKSCCDENYIGSIEGFIIDNKDFNFRDKPTYYFENENLIHPDDHPPQYCYYLFSKKILDSLKIPYSLLDDTLHKNSLDWTNYITNKDEVYKVEMEYIKNNKTKINYFNNEHPYLKWPSDNIERDI